MKESEAKIKWCPMYRVSMSINEHHPDGGSSIDNRAGRSKCIGSDCAIWVSTGATYQDANKNMGRCGLIRL